MRNQMSAIARGAALGASLWASAVCMGDEADLTPRLEAGSEQRFQVNSESVVTRAIPDLDQQLTQTTGLTYYITRKIDDSPDGTIEARLVFDRVIFRTQDPNLLGEFEDVVYDTGLRDPDTGEVKGRATLEKTEFAAMQYAEALDPLIGRSISITLTPQGSITGVNIPEELGDAELFSVEMIKDRFLPLFQIHPEGGEVPIGTEWSLESEQDSGLGFDVVSTTNWTLSEVEGDMATVQVENKFSMGEVRRESGFTLRESSGSGRVLWNTELGLLDHLTASQSIRMAGRPPEIGGAEVELVVRSSLEIRRSSEPWTLEDPAAENDPGAEPGAE